MLFAHFALLAGSLALDQICSGRVWREHNYGAVERLCLENTKQWQGNNLNSFFIFILAKNVRHGAYTYLPSASLIKDSIMCVIW